MDIFYESLDTMMASLNGDSDLKRRGCNDLTNKKTQSAPIALDRLPLNRESCMSAVRR